MGQIVIDIPTNARRRYVVSEKSRVAPLLADIDASATRIKPDKTSPEKLEDIEDIIASNRALREIVRTGKTFAWKDVKAELGL